MATTAVICTSGMAIYADEDDEMLGEVVTTVSNVVTKVACSHPIVHDAVTWVASQSAQDIVDMIDVAKEVADTVVKGAKKDGEAVKESIKYQAEHRSDPSNPLNMD